MIMFSHFPTFLESWASLCTMERLAVSLVSTNYIKEEEQEVAAEIVKCRLKGYNAKKIALRY